MRLCASPLIYKHSEQWNDITSGASSGCDGDGWPAATGWDAVAHFSLSPHDQLMACAAQVTGVGTPNYKKLVATVLALP